MPTCRPLPLLLLLLARGAAGQIPLVTVPEDTDHPGTSRPLTIPPQPIPAAALFDYDTSAPQRFTVTGSQSVDNIRLIDAAFDGARGSRVTCSLVIPPNPSHAPSIVFLHWGYSGREEFIPEAITLARRGAVCLLLDAPAARPEPVNFEPQRPGRDAATLIAAAIDCRRAVDVLRSRPDTDPSRIAFVGHGLGAAIGGMLAAAEPRFQSILLVAPSPSIADAIRDQPALACRRESLGPDRAAAYIAELRPLDPIAFIPAARPLSLMIQQGSLDREVTPDENHRFAAAAPSSAVVKTYLCGHALNDRQAQSDRAEWLADRLSLAAAHD